MAFDWKEAVRTIAPTLAGVLGTPAMGLGVKVLADALLGGGSGDPVQDEASIAGMLAGGVTPEIRLTLIEAEARVKDQLHELRMMQVANAHEIDKAEIADTADARRRDSGLAAAGQRNYRADVMFALAVVVVVALVYAVWRSQELTEFVKGIITLVLGRFLGYLDAIFNFEFGTTRSSRAKDVSIEQLSRKP